MKISKNAWHYKLLAWETYDGTLSSVDMPKNLCPYMRKLVKSIVTAPVRYAYRLLPDIMQEHADTVKILGIVAAIIHLFVWGFTTAEPKFEYEWWYTFAAYGAISGVIGTIVGLMFGVDALINLRENKKKDCKVSGPNIVTQYIKAKHNKICPIIEFVKDEDDL